MRFVTATILRGDSKTCFRDDQPRGCDGGEDSPDYPHRRIARTPASCISKTRSRRPRSWDQRGFGNGGGRANRRRCARWRRFPSECRVATHSDMGNDSAVSEFLKRGFAVLRALNKRNRSQPTAGVSKVKDGGS